MIRKAASFVDLLMELMLSSIDLLIDSEWRAFEQSEEKGSFIFNDK